MLLWAVEFVDEKNTKAPDLRRAEDAHIERIRGEGEAD